MGFEDFMGDVITWWMLVSTASDGCKCETFRYFLGACRFMVGGVQEIYGAVYVKGVCYNSFVPG